MAISALFSKTYTTWLTHAVGDADLVCELRAMQGDEEAIYEAFYSEMEFGTSGMRGIIGAGTNRMNIYTVAKASQGVSNYILKHFNASERKVAIGYDSRVKSDVFAEVTARVFAANGIKVFIYPEIVPVPCLSYAVRELNCAMGIVITASHNPAIYNGYKVYNSEGCQITAKVADEILEEIEGVDVFEGIKKNDFKQELDIGMIEYIPGWVLETYFEKTLNQSLIDEDIKKDIKIVYSPLHGSGYVPITRVLNLAGYENINVVKEQIEPDGRFPTCPVPNPENKEAMRLGVELALEIGADIVVATDPDCDRVGVAVKRAGTEITVKTNISVENKTDSNDGSFSKINDTETSSEYVFLSGNEVGILLLDYICSRRTELGKMPEKPLFIKTIVTSDLAETVATYYGVETRNVLTGFKYIGEQIGCLESKGEESRFIFGFEESYGYLAGTSVRDKDGVVATLLVCEMAAYYRSLGKTLLERLKEIHEKHGYCVNSTYSFEFSGAAGNEKMKEIMTRFRNVCNKEDGDINTRPVNIKIIGKIDYKDGINDLPKADVIKFILEDSSSMIIRPSGTEPKIKVYLSVNAASIEEARGREERLMQTVNLMLERTEFRTK